MHKRLRLTASKSHSVASLPTNAYNPPLAARTETPPSPVFSPRTAHRFGQFTLQRAVTPPDATATQSEETTPKLAEASPALVDAHGAGQPLPAPTQAAMGHFFGHDFAQVRVHEGAAARRVGALAFTRGADIFFRPGLYNPHSRDGQALLGHELAHVVQQSTGRVAAPQGKGWAVNADQTLEHEADALGMQAAAAMQHGLAGEGPEAAGTQRATLLPLAASSMKVIQRKVDTMGGEWDTDYYTLIKNGTRHGVDIKLRFKPGPGVDATKIGLTQMVKSYKNSTPYTINANPTVQNRSIGAADATVDHLDEPTQGSHIDRIAAKNNPIYGGNDLGAGADLSATTTAGNAHTGYRYQDQNSNTEQIDDAWLTDGPELNDSATNSGCVFETSALALNGNQSGTFYGSVKWGWRTDDQHNHSLIPLEVISNGAPSPTFIKAAELWAANTTASGGTTKPLPTGNLIPLFFELKYASRPGEDLFVTGDKPELGSWDTNKAVKLRFADAQTWKGMVTLNADKAIQPIEYKYFRKEQDNLRWEEGGNHRPGNLPQGGQTRTYRDVWDNAR
jgi:hypothetical protein